MLSISNGKDTVETGNPNGKPADLGKTIRRSAADDESHSEFSLSFHVVEQTADGERERQLHGQLLLEHRTDRPVGVHRRAQVHVRLRDLDLKSACGSYS